MTYEIKQRIEQIKNGQVPEGYKTTKVGIVPIDWTYEKLDKYLIQHHEISEYSNQYPVLTSSRKGIFLQSEYYNREVASEDNTGYNVVPYGYFTYRHMSDDEIFKFNINTLVDKGIVSTLYPVFTTMNINDYFLQMVLNEGREFHRFAILQKQGGSRTYMYFDKLKKLKVCLPPLEEQEKIAEILSAQDKVIELYQRKIEEIQKLKKIYLRKMFPKKGETVPEVRFPQFTAPWERRKLGEVAGRIYGGGTPKTSVEEYWNGNVPWLQSSNLSEHELFSVDIQKHITKLGLQKSAAQLVPKNSIAVVSHVGVGKLVFMPFDYTTSQDFISLSELSLNPIFMCYVIYKRLQEDLHIVQGSAIKGITKDDLLSKEIMFPNLEEQQQIGTFFRNFDNLITLHKRKLEELKNQKKALMQLLLTGIVRVTEVTK